MAINRWLFPSLPASIFHSHQYPARQSLPASIFPLPYSRPINILVLHQICRRRPSLQKPHQIMLLISASIPCPIKNPALHQYYFLPEQISFLSLNLVNFSQCRSSVVGLALNSYFIFVCFRRLVWFRSSRPSILLNIFALYSPFPAHY